MGSEAFCAQSYKGERSSNSKTLAVSPLDRILELGPGRPLNLSPSCCLLSSGLGRFPGFLQYDLHFETPEEVRDRVVEAFDYMRVDNTDGFRFSLLRDNDFQPVTLLLPRSGAPTR